MTPSRHVRSSISIWSSRHRAGRWRVSVTPRRCSLHHRRRHRTRDGALARLCGRYRSSLHCAAGVEPSTPWRTSRTSSSASSALCRPMRPAAIAPPASVRVVYAAPVVTPPASPAVAPDVITRSELASAIGHTGRSDVRLFFPPGLDSKIIAEKQHPKGQSFSHCFLEFGFRVSPRGLLTSEYNLVSCDRRKRESAQRSAA
jgi:hypothetical protein